MFLGVLTYGLLCALMRGGVCECVLKNYTLLIEKHGCDQCVAVNTTICSGFCYSQDTNVRGRVGKNYVIQQGCMPQSLVYRPALVPGCPQHVNPLLYYPEYSLCHCSRCHGQTHHCISMRPASPTTQPAPCPGRLVKTTTKTPSRKKRYRLGN